MNSDQIRRRFWWDTNRYWRARCNELDIEASRAYQVEKDPTPRDIAVMLRDGIVSVPLYGPFNPEVASTCSLCLRPRPCHCAGALAAPGISWEGHELALQLAAEVQP